LKQATKGHNTDILVISETRARTIEEGLSIYIQGSHLQATMATSAGRPSAGVTVLTGAHLILIEGSIRESDPQGHYVLGVYTIYGIRVIIGGIYLDSSNSDHTGVTAIQNLSAHITDLQQLYDTTNVILTGDFNVVLYPDQCHSGRIIKPRTSQELHDLADEHGLRDTGRIHGKETPTYRRHGDAGVYSRIDYTLSSMQTQSYDLSWGPFDHAYLTVMIHIPIQRQLKPPRVKDWIIGSEQFLQQGRQVIIQTLLEHDQHDTQVTRQEMHNMITIGIPEGFERRLQISNTDDGITEVHVLNVIIKKLQLLAGRLDRQERDRVNHAILQTDKALKLLHTEIQAPALTDEARIGLNTRITEHKVHLRDSLLQRATQEAARIDTFQNTNRGRMTKCSFTGIKNKKAHKMIDRLHSNGQDVTDQEHIVQIMRDKYMQCTGQEQPVADDAVTQFLQDMDVTLPTLTPDQQDHIGDEISRDEVASALRSAKAHSAPGPTGQTLGFYKYLFQQIPYIFTLCINRIVYVDDLLDSPSLAWIKQRRIIYIPKPGKDPLLPSSYRPLSLLEVFYKIPAKILTDRIGCVLPDISYPDQCGFVPGRGAQYSTLAAGHAIHDAETTGSALQLLGIDISSAFDSISGECIKQCMLLNGFPSHFVSSVHNLTKLGIAQVEVNGKQGQQFVQKSGVGQGDPLSAFRFNIGTEPLLRALCRQLTHITYKDTALTSIHPSAYADDHLHVLSVREPQDIANILGIYTQYTAVSGLRINTVKTELLTINTAQQLVQDITALTGITAVNQLTLLGVRYTNTYQGSIDATFTQIDTKAMARRMRITTRATHMLHRRLVIQATLEPIYSHAFMAFGSNAAINKKIAELIKEGMWTQTLGQESKQIRVQVAYQRVFAGYDMGGLNIAHPQQVNEGLMLNTLERLLHKEAAHEDNMHMAPNITRIFKNLATHLGCAPIQQIFRHGGALAWRQNAARIVLCNKYLGACMYAMARFCTVMETRQETWHTAPLWGHTKANPIMSLTQQDAEILRAHGIHTIGQIFDSGLGMFVQSHSPLRTCPAGIDARIWAKVGQLHSNLQRSQILRNGIQLSHNTIQVVRRVGTFSQLNRQLYKEAMAAQIKAPPSFHTRRRDGLPLPSLDSYCKAYEALMTCTFITTAATAFNFAALNRTVWTAKKQALSGNAGGGRQNEPLDSGRCKLCDSMEDTAHILTDCNGYSYLLWERFNVHVTAACRRISQNHGRVSVTFNNIMYFTRIDALAQEHVKRVRALIMEIKRDIYVRRTERCLSDRVQGRIYTEQRIDMHISIACHRIMQILAYKGKTAGILATIRDCCLGL
jgi:hypothetical protein